MRLVFFISFTWISSFLVLHFSFGAVFAVFSFGVYSCCWCNCQWLRWIAFTTVFFVCVCVWLVRSLSCSVIKCDLSFSFLHYNILVRIREAIRFCFYMWMNRIVCLAGFQMHIHNHMFISRNLSESHYVNGTFSKNGSYWMRRINRDKHTLDSGST